MFQFSSENTEADVNSAASINMCVLAVTVSGGGGGGGGGTHSDESWSFEFITESSLRYSSSWILNNYKEVSKGFF